MKTYTYHTTGKQQPVFLCPDAAVCRFMLLGHAQLEMSYDPPNTSQQAWLPYEGGSVGVLYGPPTAVRVISAKDNVELEIW